MTNPHASTIYAPTATAEIADTRAVSRLDEIPAVPDPEASLVALAASQRRGHDRRAIASQRSTAGEDVAAPLGTFPRRIPVRSADGRRWDVLTCARQTVATTTSGTVAVATIEDAGDRVVVEFWTSAALPHELRAKLVEATFAHPAIRGQRPVLLCVPIDDSEVLTEARDHLHGPSSHVAGSTCLIEGRVAARA